MAPAPQEGQSQDDSQGAAPGGLRPRLPGHPGPGRAGLGVGGARLSLLPHRARATEPGAPSQAGYQQPLRA